VAAAEQSKRSKVSPVLPVFFLVLIKICITTVFIIVHKYHASRTCTSCILLELLNTRAQALALPLSLSLSISLVSREHFAETIA